MYSDVCCIRATYTVYKAPLVVRDHTVYESKYTVLFHVRICTFVFVGVVCHIVAIVI
jgi:hypothetical protein